MPQFFTSYNTLTGSKSNCILICLAVQIYGKEEENVKQLALRLTDVVKSNMDFLSGKQKEQSNKKIQVLGPAPANISKINDIYRYVFYVKHAEYDVLLEVKDRLEETLRQWQPRQMIQFVADGSGQQFCSFYFDGLHIHIQCFRFHIIGSGYDAELTGYAKTPFLSGLLSTALYDAGVDQNIRILSGGIDHHDSLQDTYEDEEEE